MTDIYRSPGSGPKPKDVTVTPQSRAIAMTPGEHYVVAEGILEALSDDANITRHGIANAIAVAQVHATLANVDPNRTWPRKWTTGLPEKI